MIVRAVFFDAVGTLLHPAPSAAQVYVAMGQRFNSRLERDEIARRFSTSFREQEELDHAAGNVTSPEREVARWRAIVTTVLDDVRDANGCFTALWDHFAQPASWSLEPEAGSVLARLASAGLQVGLASNFDARLHEVRAGFREFDVLNHVVVSSEVGHRKPAAGFFAELANRTGLPPEQILLIGDDPGNDIAGARAAGLRALRFAPREADYDLRDLRDLRDLADLLRLLGVD